MKKIFCLLLMIIVVVGCFAGCSKSDSQNGDVDFVEDEIMVDEEYMFEDEDVFDEEELENYSLSDLDFKVDGASIDFLGLTVTEFCQRTDYKAIAVGDVNDSDSNLNVNVDLFGHVIVEKDDKTLYLDVINRNDGSCPILDCEINGITDEYDGPLNYGDYHPVSCGLSVNGIKIGDAVTCEDIEKALNMKAFEGPDSEDFGIVTFTGFSENPYYDLCFGITDGKLDSICLAYVI